MNTRSNLHLGRDKCNSNLDAIRVVEAHIHASVSVVDQSSLGWVPGEESLRGLDVLDDA